MKWFNPQCAPFQISGFPFYEKEQVYRRLPLGMEGILPDALCGLADETAGGQIRFHGKLKDIKIQVSLAAKPGFFEGVKAPHLTRTTKSAFDLYLSKDGKDYVFCSVAKMQETDRFYTATLLDLQEPEELDVLLNFPLYGGVDKILIGVDDDAEISAPHYRFRNNKKIAIYGGSIQQGSSASRPGVCFSNLMSRWMDTEVYNLGFNSSGKAEPEVAQLISRIPDLSALVISVEGNCPDGPWLDEKLRGFLDIFREQYPTIPVIIMPFLTSGQDALHPWWGDQRKEFYRLQKQIVADRQAAGDKNIYLVPQDDFIPRELEGHSIWHECTVDGLHLTDLGYYWVIQGLVRFLKDLGL